MTNLTDDERNRIRWHFDAHAENPKGGYASVGLANIERILAARLCDHEARVTMLAATFARYAEEVAALPPVGATGRLDAMDRREATVWARAAGMLLAALDEASA